MSKLMKTAQVKGFRDSVQTIFARGGIVLEDCNGMVHDRILCRPSRLSKIDGG